MALLDNILKKIKAATLDRTNLDEKITSAVGSFGQNVVRPAYQTLARGFNTMQDLKFGQQNPQTLDRNFSTSLPYQTLKVSRQSLADTGRQLVGELAESANAVSDIRNAYLPWTVSPAEKQVMQRIGHKLPTQQEAKQNITQRGALATGLAPIRLFSAATSPATYAFFRGALPSVYGALGERKPGESIPEASLRGVKDFAGPSRALRIEGTPVGKTIDTVETIAGLLNRGFDDMAFGMMKGADKASKVIKLTTPQKEDIYTVTKAWKRSLPTPKTLATSNTPEKIADKIEISNEIDRLAGQIFPKLRKHLGRFSFEAKVRMLNKALEEDGGFFLPNFLGIKDTTPSGNVNPRAASEAAQADLSLTRTTKPLPQTPPETAASAKPASSPIFPEPAKSDSLLPLKKSEPQGKRLDQILSGQTSEAVPSDEIIQQARGEIGSLPVKGDKPLRQQLRDFYTNWVNRFQPLEDVATKVEKETKSSILPQYDPRYTTRRLLGAGAVAEYRHQNVLQPILDELGDIPSSDFDVYLKAKRDLNLGERGIKGSDAAKAQAVIDALGQKYDAGKMESVAQKLYAYQDEGLAMLRDAGIISPEVHARIKDTSKNYVPFQRVMDEVDNYLGLPTQKAYLGSQPVKKIKGSERQILSPVESIIANTYKIESAVSRNRVAQSLVNLRNVAPQYQDMFERVDKDSAEAIAVWENGKKVYYRVGEDIANAVKGLNEESAGILTKILSAPARLLRQGATGRNIDFMIPNVFKDQFDAAISSKYGYRPFVDYFRGLAHLLNYKRAGSDQIVEEWINSGGKMFFENMGGRKQIGEQILDATQKKGLLKQLGEWAGGGIDAIGELSETPTRLGLYMRAKEATGNQWLSMMESREGTLDFARMGAKMKTANAIIPFLNVGVQGFDKLIRAAKDNPAKMALNMTLYAGLPQLLVSLYDNLFHPQEYANIPQWEKDTNFIVVTGQGEGGKPAYIKIPKGNIVPYIANPTDQLVSFLAGNDRQSFGQMALSLLSEGLPVVSGGSNVKEIAARTIGSNIPQAFKPLVENVMNKSTFYTNEQGNPQDIVPYYLEKKPAPQQFKKSTPEAYKALGKILNVSPLKAQNLLEGYLSGFVKTPVNIAQMLTDVSKGKPLDPNKVPILRRFYGEREDYQSASAKPQVESRFAANAAEPNFLQRLFNRGVKEEQVQKLPTDPKDLSVIYGEAKKDLDAYNEKKLKIEYGNYEEWEKQSKLEALDSEYQYAKQMTDRIEKEQPEAVLEMNLDLYSSAGSRTVEERSAWAAEQLAKAAGKEEFEKLVDRMLTARVLTKSVVEALRKQGVNVSRYTEGGKVKSFGGTGSAKSTKSLAAVFKAMRADNEEAAKLSQPSKRKLPTALSLVLKQSRPKKPSADSLDRILSQKRSQARKPIDVIRGLQRL